MVVDDHPVNLLFMRQMLTRMGFNNFVEAESGKKAIELFQKEPYDLILMDCKIPDMDGYEATKQIRQLEFAEHAPTIIAVTADAMKTAQEECLAAGMDDYISKPVNKEKLYALLREWLPCGDREKVETIPIVQTLQNDPFSENHSVFNQRHLAEFTNGDRETEKIFIDMFLENMEADLENLQKYFQSKNFVKWEETAHKLCGASSYLGAEALANVCDQAQLLTEADTEKIKNLHQHIITEAQTLSGILVKSRKAA